MRRLMMMCAAAMLTACAWAIGASQEWVKDYIAKLNGGTNNVISVNAGAQFGVMEARYELATVMTLVATNSVTSSVTNGLRFVYTTNGVYKTGISSGEKTITATQTGFVWNGTNSIPVNGVDTFLGSFGVFGEMVVPSKAEEFLR